MEFTKIKIAVIAIICCSSLPTMHSNAETVVLVDSEIDYTEYVR